MKILLTLLLTIYMNAVGLSEQAQSGKELFIDANCQQCHGIDASYVKKDLTATRADIGRWVRTCDNIFNSGWFPEEQLEVEQYIKEIHYKK
jgi:hypothetical protein